LFEKPFLAWGFKEEWGWKNERRWEEGIGI